MEPTLVPPASPVHNIALHVTLEVIDAERLSRYLQVALGDQQGARPTAVVRYLSEELGRAAHGLPGVQVLGFRGSATGS